LYPLVLAHCYLHSFPTRRSSDLFDEYNKVAKLSASDLERGYSQMFAHQWLANELRSLGNYVGAASAYQAAIQVKANDSAAHCQLDRKSTRLNSSHQIISYAVFCL